MTGYDEKLREILKLYEELRDIYKTELEQCPEGSLLYQKKGKYQQFMHSTVDNGKRKRRGINNDTELLKALARKEFGRRAYEIVSHNVAAIREAIDKQITFDPNMIIKSMNKGYSLLPEEYFFNLNEWPLAAELSDESSAKIRRHEEWWRKPYKEYQGYPEYKTKITSRGQKVRSVSELLISEALYRYSIPFHYEEELEVDGKTFAPDFTFEGRDYNKFYLDYFGMMNNENYARKNFIKLNDYYNIGLIPGDNLIVVFDSNGLMNAAVIESIINNEVIPRL